MHPGGEVQLKGEGHMVLDLCHPIRVPVQLHSNDIASRVQLCRFAAVCQPASGQIIVISAAVTKVQEDMLNWTFKTLLIGSNLHAIDITLHRQVCTCAVRQLLQYTA